MRDFGRIDGQKLFQIAFWTAALVL